MPPLSPAQARRRRRLRAWLPTVLVAAVCAAFVVGALAMQNSWWVDPGAPPASDQQGPDGASRFDRAGEDYFVREGVARVTLREDAPSAADVGLADDGTRTIEPLVPVTVVILVPDGVLVVDSVSSLTLETSAGRVRAVSLSPDLPGSWPAVSADLQKTASEWGWSAEDLARLSDDVTTLSRSGGGVATLPAREARGALVSADVRVDPAASLSYRVAAPQ